MPARSPAEPRVKRMREREIRLSKVRSDRNASANRLTPKMSRTAFKISVDRKSVV